MAPAILFIRWDQPHVGKVDEAYGFLTTEGLAYLKKQEGKFVERVDMIGLTAHAGDMNGALILTGERAKLDELRRTDEFEAFSFKMSSLFSRYGVIPGLNFEGIKLVMARMEAKKK